MIKGNVHLHLQEAMASYLAGSLHQSNLSHGTQTTIVKGIQELILRLGSQEGDADMSFQGNTGTTFFRTLVDQGVNTMKLHYIKESMYFENGDVQGESARIASHAIAEFIHGLLVNTTSSSQDFYSSSRVLENEPNLESASNVILEVEERVQDWKPLLGPKLEPGEAQAGVSLNSFATTLSKKKDPPLVFQK